MKSTLVIEPIGSISTPFTAKSEAPHQPDALAATEGIVQLLPGRNFDQALEDLAGMEKIWLLYWFDRNPNWKPKIQVPRGPRVKRGVFATRSPHRPNPIGLSLVDLISVEGLTLRVRNVDLLDGTPILDIKPYLPAIEAFPTASAGWIDELQKELETPRYAIEYSPLADEQLAFLESLGVNLRLRIERTLSQDPTPHPYKRIEKKQLGLELGIRAWRVRFRVEADRVMIDWIGSGYDEKSFESGKVLADDELQRAFVQQFGHQ